MLRSRSVLSFAALGAAFLASVAQAQTLQMGSNVPAPNASDVALADVRTDIDLVRPATATGVVDTVSFQWTTLGCLGAVKIKFFRREGDTLVFLTERGPFDSIAFPTPVSMVPPVAVDEGDLIGITRLTTCGNPSTQTGTISAGYVGYSSDLTGNVALSTAEIASPDILAVYGTGTATESLMRVIPAAASTPGDHGSFFRTGVQLFNPGLETVSGRFVFHPAGVSGSSTDPSITFTLAPGQTAAYPDLVATLAGAGLGSIDVVLPESSQTPVIITRVFNDAGTDGTSGFTEDAVNPVGGGTESTLLFTGATGFLVAPADTTHFRFNMGVRTFLSGASVTFRVHDATGAVVQTVNKVYLPTYYEQQSSETFLGVVLEPNDTIEVNVSSGSAVVYGATTDNTTNDPSIQFAHVLFAIL